MNVVIIGGGAAGMTATISASENPDCQVILLERQSRLGKKLAATGNGRCNLSNVHATAERYYDTFVKPALEQFPVADTLAWFRTLGLLTVAEDSGKVYPYSDQANSVLDVLRLSLERPNIQVELDCECTKIWKKPDGFLVKTSKGDFFGEKLILACGGIAGTKLGGTDLGYQLAKPLGHKTTALHPSLVQVTCRENTAPLKGIRTQVAVSVLDDGTQGEIQFTEKGLSGPAMFEVSRTVSTAGREVDIHLDFLPSLTKEEIQDWIAKRPGVAEHMLTGILHNKLGQFLVKQAGISLNCPVSRLKPDQLDCLVNRLKDTVYTATGTLGFDSCQVTVGGLELGDFCPETLESKKHPGLFACGELLDIDGPCGGYNLQWAWSSGRLVSQKKGNI